MDKSKFYIYRMSGSPVVHIAGESPISVDHIECNVPTWSLVNQEGLPAFVMCGIGTVHHNFAAKRCVIVDDE